MSQHSGKTHRQSLRLKSFDYTTPGAYFITMNTHDRLPLFGKIVKGVMCLSDMGQHVNKVWHDIPERFPWVEIDAFQIMPDHVHAIIWIRNQRDTTKSNDMCRGEWDSPTDGVSGSAIHGSPAAPKHHDAPILFHDNNPDELDSHKHGRATDLPKPTGEWDSPKRAGEWDSPKRAGEWDSPKRAGEWDSPLQHHDIRQPPRGTSKTVGSVVRGIKIPVTQWARNHHHVQNVWQRNYFERIIHSQQSLERIRRYIMNNPMQWQIDHDHKRTRTRP